MKVTYGLYIAKIRNLRNLTFKMVKRPYLPYWWSDINLIGTNMNWACYFKTDALNPQMCIRIYN